MRATIPSERPDRYAIVKRGSNVLKLGAAMVGLAAGAERWLHEQAPPDFPRVSTRGHFTVGRQNECPGGIGSLVSATGYGRVRLKPGHNTRDYDTVGTIPGRDTPDAPEELLIFIHGWLADEPIGLGRFSKMEYELTKNGYDHPVIGFAWDAKHFGWRTIFRIADRNGPKLGQFVSEYKRANPETDVRLLSNSIASRILLESVRSLHRSDATDQIASASVLVGANDSRSVARSGTYGPAIESVVGTFHNYWHHTDEVLNTAYRIIEGEPAMGGTGVIGEPPPNYIDHEIDEVSDHISTYSGDEGCIARVVDDIETG